MPRLASDSEPIRIATRGSALALVQARLVQALCQRHFPDRRFELRVMKTTGDRLQSVSLQRPGSELPKGLFTKELESALHRGEADLAVHSLKDLPTSLPDGLILGAVLPRADVRDVLITGPALGGRPAAPGIADLPSGTLVATSSTRRVAQLIRARPDLRTAEIRGNVPTRLRKVAADGGPAATILAAAGLARLGIELGADGSLRVPAGLGDDGWSARLRGAVIPAEVMLPAPGQAAIGIECRRGDRAALRLCRRLDDAASRACVEAERAFLAGLGGGCQSPVAAWARGEADGRLRIAACMFEGDACWREEETGLASRPRELGRRMAHRARKDLPAWRTRGREAARGPGGWR